MQIEILWFDGCPNYHDAERLVKDVVGRLAVHAAVLRINVRDKSVAEAVRFPGSPTIRVNGRDIQPGWQDDGEYALRCRVYPTQHGMRGLPDSDWLAAAIRQAMDEPCAFPGASDLDERVKDPSDSLTPPG